MSSSLAQRLVGSHHCCRSASRWACSYQHVAFSSVSTPLPGALPRPPTVDVICDPYTSVNMKLTPILSLLLILSFL
ncbi:hypothetical protein LMH87_010624 [Akanthomyces muscarius]|uniref:Uncharacterized protein n=1 Tax=Akanthomyces muscarius TaxID=2231603 RepID=A0A9W8QFW2_AKAMU|nr:hypothetical protein LMH87_010624 [Akanthomyces muscarius]KAJ4154163.1 hypothetical protein LMH87_010624 [Akanthomyces muscarius]